MLSMLTNLASPPTPCFGHTHFPSPSPRSRLLPYHPQACPRPLRASAASASPATCLWLGPPTWARAPSCGPCSRSWRARSRWPSARAGGEFPGKERILRHASPNIGTTCLQPCRPRGVSLTPKHYWPAAPPAPRYLPVESAMPGTTLGLIPLQAFSAGGTLYGRPLATTASLLLLTP